MKNNHLSTGLVCLFLLLNTGWSHAQRNEVYDKIVDSLQQNGLQDKIIPYFEGLLKKNPKDEQALRWIGVSYLNKGNGAEAEKYYQLAIKVNPKCARCYMNIGRSYWLRNQKEEALNYLNTAIATDPADEYCYNVRGGLKLAMNDKSGAEMDYNKCVELAPKSAEAYLNRANFYFNDNSPALAMADVNRAIGLDPGNATAHFTKGNFLYEQRKIKEATASLDEALRLDSTIARAYAIKAAIYSYLGDTKASVTYYKKCLQIDSSDFQVLYFLSLERYKQEDMDGSCGDLIQALHFLKKSNPEYPQRSDIETSIHDFCDSALPGYFYQRGIAQYNLQQYKKAVEFYSRGIKKFPENTFLISFRGNALLADGAYAEALKDYFSPHFTKEKIEKDARENPRLKNISADSMSKYIQALTASNNLSIAQSYFGLGKFDDALFYINKAIESSGAGSELLAEYMYNTRGTILLAGGKSQEAFADFDRAIKINKDYDEAYINRAIARMNNRSKVPVKSMAITFGYNNKNFNANYTFPIEYKLKKKDENLTLAIEDCNSAIALKPDFAYAWYIRAQLKKMNGQGDYCLDFVKAKELGFNLEPEIIKICNIK